MHEDSERDDTVRAVKCWITWKCSPKLIEMQSVNTSGWRKLRIDVKNIPAKFCPDPTIETTRLSLFEEVAQQKDEQV